MLQSQEGLENILINSPEVASVFIPVGVKCVLEAICPESRSPFNMADMVGELFAILLPTSAVS